jgi:hypothetical protein
MFFALVLGIVIGSCVAYTELQKRYGDPLFGFTISIMIILMVFGISSMLLSYFVGDDVLLPETDYVDQYDIDLIAIADGTLTEGSIRGGLFVTTGYISERPVYLYYKQESNGGIRQQNVSVNRATIYEDSFDGTAYITVRQIEYLEEYNTDFIHHDGAWWSNWYSPFWNFDSNEGKNYDIGSVWYDIHLPPGSVVRDFVLDLN